MRRAARVDANQKEIVEYLRKRGASVQLLHTVGKGCPDIVVGYGGCNYLFEIKDGSKPASQRKLTPDEQEWHDEWKGSVLVVACKWDVDLEMGWGEDDE
jgi:Holliday junction resolvase